MEKGQVARNIVVRVAILDLPMVMLYVTLAAGQETNGPNTELERSRNSISFQIPQS